MIVSPPHLAGDALAEFAAAVLGIAVDRRCRHLTLRFGPGQSLAETGGVSGLTTTDQPRAILVLDDVVTTGARLRVYQRSLRDLGYRGLIHYVVGVARLSDARERTRLENVLGANQYGARHTFTPVEEVVLPDWDDRDCPWCVEQRFLRNCIQNLYKDEVVPAALFERWGILQATPDDGGLHSEIFVMRPGEAEVPLGDNSYFVVGGASASMVFAAVAGALQRLRNKPDSNNGPPRLAPLDYPIVSVLDPKDIGERYTDALLRSAYLRAARRDELEQVRAAGEERRIEISQRILQSVDVQDRGAACEILINIALGKIPPQVLSEEVREALSRAGCGFMVDLVNRVLAAGAGQSVG